MTPLPLSEGTRRRAGSSWADVGVWLATASGVFAEALCPAIILAILFDCTSFRGWIEYDRDTSIYATIARFWPQGMMPYRDIYDFKPPLIFAALRAGFALWDYHPESLRRILMGLTAAGSLVMYFGLRRSGALIAAPLATLGLLTLIVPDSTTAMMQNTEPLVAAFTAAAIGCAAAHQRAAAWRWALAAGACVGLATLGKQPGIIFALPVVVQLALSAGPRTGWERLRHALGRSLLAAAGFVLVMTPVALYFAWRGALSALYHAVFVDGGRYAGVQLPIFLTPRGFLEFLKARGTGAFKGWLGTSRAWPFVWAVATLVPATVLAPSRRVLIPWAWLVAGYLAVIAGTLGDPHYLTMAYPSLALALGLIFQLVLEGFPQPTCNARRQLLGAVLMASLLFGDRWETVYLPARAVALANVATDPAEVVGERIRQAAKPGDTLFVEDQPFSIYVYAGIPPVSRFIYWNAPNPEAEPAFGQSLELQPTFVFVAAASAARLRKGVTEAGMGFALLSKALTTHYEELFRCPGGGIVYRRSDGARGALIQPVVRLTP